MTDNLLESKLREMIRATWGDPPERASFPALVVKVLDENGRLRTLLATASVFEVPDFPPGTPGRPIRVERIRQHDGSVLWAVRSMCYCLCHDGEWDYEPLPSSRTDEWLAARRFPTREAALAAVMKMGRDDAGGEL